MSQDSVSSVSSVGSVTVEERRSAALKGGQCPAVAGLEAHVHHFEKAAGVTVAQLAAGVESAQGRLQKAEKRTPRRRKARECNSGSKACGGMFSRYSARACRRRECIRHRLDIERHRILHRP